MNFSFLTRSMYVALGAVILARIDGRFLTMCLAATLLTAFGAPSQASENASWMRHNWGIRVVLPSGDMKEVKTFDPVALADQLATLRTAKWVQINLTRPARGGYYTAPSPELAQINPRMVPQRDIFGETITALRKHGFRVMVYFAAQGPNSAFALRKKATSSYAQRQQRDSVEVGDSWSRYLSSTGTEHHEAVARLCIAPFSKRYGKQIDGWWFDHGRFGNASLYMAAAREGNPNTAIAWNLKHKKVKLPPGDPNAIPGQKNVVWDLAKSNADEDYTAGHITLIRLHAPNWRGNERIFETMERNPTIDGAVPHVFIPMQETWRSGKNLFESSQAEQWTTRAVAAGGALTWAVALRKPEYQHSELEPAQYQVLLDMDRQLRVHRPAGLGERTMPQ